MPSELCAAIRRGDAHRVLDLLENGASANEVDNNGDNALHWAVFCRHMDLCELLLRRGADWRKKTGRAGYTLLHDAAWDGSVRILTHAYYLCISQPTYICIALNWCMCMHVKILCYKAYTWQAGACTCNVMAKVCHYMANVIQNW